MYPCDKDTVLIYVRSGSLTIDGTEAPVHALVKLDVGDSIELLNSSNKDSVDCLVLMGNPSNEPVAAQGSMVMNSQAEIYQAYQDYQLGKMGKPWDHSLSHEEWRAHVEANPCQYQYQSVKGEEDPQR